MKYYCTLLLFVCLLSVIVVPAYGQRAGSMKVDNDDETRLYFSGALNYNSSCDEKKIGVGTGLDMKNRRDRFLILSARNDMTCR